MIDPGHSPSDDAISEVTVFTIAERDLNRRSHAKGGCAYRLVLVVLAQVLRKFCKPTDAMDISPKF